ncbi:MAG: ACT domain-containing protein [Clostridia bacterium]|nr:ACT domain-containing protein [Clostridia bacterium]
MKCVLTVIGKDKPGIIAKVSNLLANKNVNIEDISQTIMQSTFTMIMLVNIENATATMKDLKEELVSLGEEIGVSIHLQHEAVFDAMHKV